MRPFPAQRSNPMPRSQSRLRQHVRDGMHSSPLTLVSGLYESTPQSPSAGFSKPPTFWLRFHTTGTNQIRNNARSQPPNALSVRIRTNPAEKNAQNEPTAAARLARPRHKTCFRLPVWLYRARLTTRGLPTKGADRYLVIAVIRMSPNRHGRMRREGRSVRIRVRRAAENDSPRVVVVAG